MDAWTSSKACWKEISIEPTIQETVNSNAVFMSSGVTRRSKENRYKSRKKTYKHTVPCELKVYWPLIQEKTTHIFPLTLAHICFNIFTGIFHIYLFTIDLQYVTVQCKQPVQLIEQTSIKWLAMPWHSRKHKGRDCRSSNNTTKHKMVYLWSSAHMCSAEYMKWEYLRR